MGDSERRRQEMVERQIEARGVRDPAVLHALRTVPREAFLPPELEEFAYLDTPLPIEEGQTISQPYIVALMTEALGLRTADRVLEIGTGSGYAAAVLGHVAREVFSVERHGELAAIARRRLEALGLDNVHVLHGDGTLGWKEHAPYDAIVVAAGGPDVPEALLDQLAPGGRLVIPVGDARELQELVRLTREPDGSLRRESLGGVRFVPLVGVQGWTEEQPPVSTAADVPRPSRPETVAALLREVAHPIDDIDTVDLGSLLERIGDARVVLIGEATHGTSEFYRMRARITRELVRSRGFDVVAIEGDWPDAARVNRWVRGVLPTTGSPMDAFTRFPTWMWRNHETLEFAAWLREHNRDSGDRGKVGFYGLDLYSMFASIRAVVEYLDRVDPDAARVARERYACLTPWEGDPQSYARAALTGRYRVCEKEAVAMLLDLTARRLAYAERDGDEFLNAQRNASLVANAESYYRAMYYGGNESWNQRDSHMAETLDALLDFHGSTAKAVVWAHNSHVGDARATEMGVRGQLDIGQLCRQKHGQRAYLIGFGTDRGTVAAAHDWEQPMEVMSVRPAHAESYEGLCATIGVPAFLAHLREPDRGELRDELLAPRLERAIGVVYRPETELQSHYFYAALPLQFDEYVWFTESHAVHPLTRGEVGRLPGEHPFAVSAGG